jgi:hypothetical protein
MLPVFPFQVRTIQITLLSIFCQFGLILDFKTPETCQEIYMNGHILVGGTSVHA